MTFRSPVAEIGFLLAHVAGYDLLTQRPRFAEAGLEFAADLLAAAGRLCDDKIAPTRRAGDLHPARLEEGRLVSPPGFREAYAQIADGGWIGMTADPALGGMGLPFTLATAVNEMMAGANLALQLNPLLSQGQIAALQDHAPAWLRERIVPHLVSGHWAGTMALTEPQAGSDVGALMTRAEPAPDGSFRLSGQKIFITWGDNDCVANVSHLVLARLPDAPKGVKGISLFHVPKFLPDAQGDAVVPNAIRVLGLEAKMGLHGSPTATLAFEGATGWLVGPPHGGMEAMFTMMNHARVGVASQGTGVAQAALQQATAYAQERVQFGKPIIAQPDVARMLAEVKADLLAARAIMLSCAVAIDMAKDGAPEWAARAGLLTPIAKAFCTDFGHEAAQVAIQIHGGAGYIEETGLSQYARDVRITAIYEGTNGIQAMDLVGRKLADGGIAACRLIDEVIACAQASSLPHLAAPVLQAARALRASTQGLVLKDISERGGVAVPYLRAFARVLGAQAHLAAAHADRSRIPLAAFYILRMLPAYTGLLAQVDDAAATLAALTGSDFGA